MSATGQGKPKALIVDDDNMVLQTVAAILELHGFEAWRCKDAYAAVELLEKSHPDVLLTDIRMPGMSGTDLLLQLKKEGQKFPVIVMTGYADLDTAVDAVKGGAFDFIRKPFDPGYLVQTVKKAVEHYRLLALERDYLTCLEQEVQRKTAEIQQTSKLKSEFLNNISHEIRTPVNGIVGMLSLATETEDRKELAEYLGYARFSAMQLVRVVDDLVLLSGMITGSVKPTYTPDNVCDLVDRALKRATGGASRRDVRFVVETEGSLPKCLLLEKMLLELALFQLFENEIKFAIPGAVVIGINYAVSEALLTIEVRDSGPGIPVERRKLIEEPFVQGDGSHTRVNGGLGIGLSIVVKIAECLEGNFSVESRKGGGSCFRLVIPVRAASEHASPAIGLT